MRTTHPDVTSDVTANPEEAWLGTFGYKPGDTVTLRNQLGTASAADVWRVRCGLLAIEAKLTLAAFRRVCDAAASDYEPYDPNDEFSQTEFGALTDSTTGGFHPGIAPIIAALVDVDDTTGAVVVTFADAPLVPPKQAA
jgi:hypothetical protein